MIPIGNSFNSDPRQTYRGQRNTELFYVLSLRLRVLHLLPGSNWANKLCHIQMLTSTISTPLNRAELPPVSSIPPEYSPSAVDRKADTWRLSSQFLMHRPTSEEVRDAQCVTAASLPFYAVGGRGVFFNGLLRGGLGLWYVGAWLWV